MRKTKRVKIIKQKRNFERNYSIIKLVALMALVIIVGAFFQNKKDTYIRNDWLLKQTQLTQTQNAVRQEETEVNQLKQENTHLKKIIFLPDTYKIALKVKQYFADDFKTALMVFKDESGLVPDRKGYNCQYGTYSGACRPEDRSLAWSVDCGVAQLNFIGTECPKEAFNVDWNLQHARAKYNARGWQPWVVWNTGRYIRNESWFYQIYSEIASL